MKARELIVTYRARPDAPTLDQRQINTPAAAAALFVPLLENQAQEVFVIALANTKHRILAYHEIAKGGLATVEVPIRNIIRAALLTDAKAIILAHNHPSGDPQPSLSDIELTRRVQEACKLFEITVLDHLIIGEGRYVSLKEYGAI